MKSRSRLACLSAAAFAAIYSSSLVRAADLTWDTNPGTAGAQDDSGDWNLTNTNWLTPAGANVAWTNSGNNAFFGNTTNTYNGAASVNAVTVTTGITVGNMTFGVGSNGAGFNVYDDFGAALLRSRAILIRRLSMAASSSSVPTAST